MSACVKGAFINFANGLSWWLPLICHLISSHLSIHEWIDIVTMCAFQTWMSVKTSCSVLVRSVSTVRDRTAASPVSPDTDCSTGSAQVNTLQQDISDILLLSSTFNFSCRLRSVLAVAYPSIKFCFYPRVSPPPGFLTTWITMIQDVNGVAVEEDSDETLVFFWYSNTSAHWNDVSVYGEMSADINECRLAPCSNGRCENTLGSYRCICRNGYMLQNNTCRGELTVMEVLRSVTVVRQTDSTSRVMKNYRLHI